VLQSKHLKKKMRKQAEYEMADKKWQIETKTNSVV
jgi:hypothetical protein